MWVQARLAMQKGDVAEAAKYYAAASKAFPPSGDTNISDEGAKALLVGENSVLTLSRGEYVDALEQLYPYAATFGGDVAYIAERVLTVDELKTFVDTHKDAQFHPTVSLDNLSTPPTPSTNPDEQSASDSGDSNNGQRPTDWLPYLLARRLVRAGRYHEALNYVSQPTAQATPAPPADFISRYVRALDDAKIATSNVDRARAWYRAAALAGSFETGPKIMGTAGQPDYMGDPIGGGVGPYTLTKGQFVTDGEYKRYEASAAKPDFRYHYLFVGVDNALRAAALLPPRSQAYAAVCATRRDG